MQIIATALLGLGTGAVPADPDHDDIKRLRDAGDILPLETIIKKYRERHRNGRLLDTELEHEDNRYVYELKVLRGDGTVLELEYDASTGELLAYELESVEEDGTVWERKYDARTGEFRRHRKEYEH